MKRNLKLETFNHGTFLYKVHELLFTRRSKQLMAPLKICADFKSIVVGVDSKEGKFHYSCVDEYQDHVVCSYDYKLVYVDGRFNKFISLLVI